jgi:hypothetical protein
MAGITFSGIDFLLRDAIVVGNSGGAEYGVLVLNYTSAALAFDRIQNCDISGFYTTSTSDYGGEIFYEGTGGGGLNNFTVLNNTLHGNSGPTSPDDNGVVGYGDGQNITNCLFQGNTVYDIGGKANDGTVGTGIIANGANGCRLQCNVAHDLGANMNTCGGPAGIWTYSSNNVTIQYNEAYNVQPTGGMSGGGCDWDGFDLDGDVTNSVVQYNYSHDNFGGGIITCAGCATGTTWGPNTIRYNVLQNNDVGKNGYYGELVLANKMGGMYTVEVYNNTVYNSNGASLLNFNQGTFTSGIIANNLFYGAGPAGSAVFQDNGEPPSWATITTNDWYVTGSAVWATKGMNYSSFGAYQSGTGWDTGSVTSNPQLDSPGMASACNAANGSQSCPSQYQLASGSPMVGAGLDLTKAPYSQMVGASDFYLRPAPNGMGSGYNIGAY